MDEEAPSSEEVPARVEAEPRAAEPKKSLSYGEYVRPPPAARQATVEDEHHFHEDEGPFGGEWPADQALWVKFLYIAKMPFAFVCHYAQWLTASLPRRALAFARLCVKSAPA